MKRKVYALLLSAVLTVALVAVPVMASGSPTTSPSTKPSTSTTTTTTTTTTAPAPTVVVDSTAPASAVKVNVAGGSVAVLATDVKKEVSSVVANATHLTNLGVSTNAKLASSFDLKYSGQIPAGGVQIPIIVNAGKVGDYAYILHRTASGQWEKVGEGVLGADRTVVGKFTSFSPVAVMLVDAANAVSTVTAPKTGN